MVRVRPLPGEPLISQPSAALLLVTLAGGWNVLRDVAHVLLALALSSF